MSLQRRIYEQNARLTEAPRDVDVKPNPETKKMIEGGKMKVVKSAPSYLGGKSIFAVLENPKAGREDDKYVMACISDPKRGAIKMFSYHGSHPSADGAMKFAKNHGLTESVELEEMSAKAHYKSVLKGGKGKGYVVGVAIDRERYPNREKEGLEGPYKSRKSGKIFYYDKKEGKYYDPDSDMFLPVSDVMERYESTDVARERDEKELKESFEFQFADKETAQKFMREISQKRLGSSTGTSDGKVRTEGPAGAGVGSPTRAHQQMAKIMKKYGGKILRTDEGPRMKRVFKEDVEQVDELTVKTLRSYISKAQKDNTQRVIRMTDKPSHMKADKGEMDKLRKRQKGVANAKTDIAMRRIAGKDYRNRMGEDVEQVDEMKYLGKDKKFGRKFYEKGGQLHVVVNDGKPQNLGSVEVKGNAKMIRGLVKEESIDLDEKLQIKLKSKFKPSSGGRDVNKIFDVIIDGVRVGIMTKETSDDHNYGDGGSYMSFKILKPGSRNKYAEHINVNDVEDPNDFFKQLKKDPRTAKRTIKAIKAHGVELTNLDSKHESVEFVESVNEESIDEAVFSKSQLDKLRAEYSKIKTVDPSQPTYGKLTAFLDKLDDAKLKQLSTAKIKFVSGLAHNRVTKRSMK